MRARLMLVFALSGMAVGCGSPAGDTDVDDHSASILTFEADELIAALDPARASRVFRAGEPFMRLGLLWDAVAEGALEFRTSRDGVKWSAWTQPEVLQRIVEQGAPAHVGRLDTGGQAATHFQFRVPGSVPAPSFLVIEPLPEAPPEPSPDEVVAEPMDETDRSAELPDGIGSSAHAISTPIGAVRIHSKSEWGGRPPRCALARHTPNRATIHHTVTPTRDSMSPQARLRQIQAFHQSVQGWCDIGYNYLISRDGRVWRGRGAGRVGAHVAGANTGNIGISFMGTHTSTPATKTQLCSAARLLARLHRDHGGLALTRSDVKGHLQYGGTACPGAALYNQIDDILRKARNGCDTR